MKAKKGTVFLGKYTSKRKLGRGAFGDVYLVEDGEKQNYALKCISKKKMSGENDHLLEYLESEVEVMKKMDCRNLVKLYEFSEDEDNYFMLMEYCDGGDLINLQVRQPDGVFSLQDTLDCLKQVVMGLEELHSKGYLHRDIKMQNVMVKTENGEKVYKVGDFGFAKKNSMRETVLGTENFMSPEVYRAGIEQVQMAHQQADYYGYEVDMWAFGVLMFYMLNRSFPFDVNPYWEMEEKHKVLAEQGREFSYRNKVVKTPKCKEVNCSDQMEDLFRKIFRVDIDKRINFAEIRQHPVFKSRFPAPSEASVILYRTKFKSSFMGKRGKNGNGVAEIKNRLTEKAKQIVPSVLCVDDDEGEYGKQQSIVELELEQIDFLKTVMEEIEVVEDDLGAVPCLMLAFNLLRYHIMLLQNFLAQLNAQTYQARHPTLKWNTFFSSPEFLTKKKTYASKQAHAEHRLQELFKKCSFRAQEIGEINPHFRACLSSHVEEESFEGDFFKSYRCSTNYFYTTLKSYLKTHKVLKFYYYLTETIICHVFNEFLVDPQLRDAMYEQYLKSEKEELAMLSYQRFHQWLRDQEKPELLALAMRIIKDCMGG